MAVEVEPQVTAKSHQTPQRSKAKQQRQAAISQAAGKLFRSQGYDKTSIQDIATEASVSPATVYNYFGTKIAILYALMDPDVQRVREAAAKVLADLPEDPLSGVVALCRCYELGTEWRDRDLLLPFAENFFLSNNSVDNPIRIVGEGRARDILELLHFYKSAGKLDAKLCEEDVIVIIASLFQYHLKGVLLTDAPVEVYDNNRISMSLLERRVRSAMSGILQVPVS